MSWNPERYLQYGDLRLRPALDLLARIPCQSPGRVADLGCGPGNVTALLAERWPGAQIVGVDSSSAMLSRARLNLPSLCWVQADIAEWAPAEPVDVLFSNSALHWLDEHQSLFARLAAMLARDGVMAVQVPANFDAPSHRLVRELAAAPRWAGLLSGERMGAVLAAADYWRLLSTEFSVVDVWESVYWQKLGGRSAVLNWLHGTTLVPYLSRLDEEQAAAFLAELGTRLIEAYPPESDDGVLFPFRRIFMIGRGARSCFT